MKARGEPDRELLLEFFFEKENELFWKKMPKRSRHMTGEIAGRIKGGYRTVKFLRTEWLVHRILWVMRNEQIPDGMLIDHIDGNKINNAPGNMRIVNHKQNNHNRALNKRNISGVSGVTWHKQWKKWAVSVDAYGKKEKAGFFDNLDDAKNAAIALKDKMHGEYSGLNRLHGEAERISNVLGVEYSKECMCDHKLQGTGGVFYQSAGLLYCNECSGVQTIRKPVK